jgi:hypothetical protein
MNYEEPLDVDALIDGEAKKVVPFPGSTPPPKSWRENVFTATALQHETFSEIMFVVPDLIPEGLTILAGRPKVGKSWLGLDVCIAVAGGTYCLGDKHPERGDVLYCALEDNRRRLQRRITKLLKVFGAKWPERLQLATDWRRLDKGGVQDLREWIEDHPEARLIILDTFAGVKPVRTTQGYQEDYQSLEELQHLAGEKGIAIIVLHHTRKMEAEDPIDTVSGTLGLAGCADCVMVLNRSSQGVTLYVRGRDIEEGEHAVNFDKHTCRWTILGNASDVHRSTERGKILAALERAGELLTPQDIQSSTGMPRNNVDQLLFKMGEAGEVVKVGRGKYRHPDRSELDPPPPDKIGKKIRNGK